MPKSKTTIYLAAPEQCLFKVNYQKHWIYFFALNFRSNAQILNIFPNFQKFLISLQEFFGQRAKFFQLRIILFPHVLKNQVDNREVTPQKKKKSTQPRYNFCSYKRTISKVAKDWLLLQETNAISENRISSYY